MSNPSSSQWSEAKQQILERRLAGSKFMDSNSGVVKLPRPDVLPLSYAQERLWFIDRMDPGSLTYAIPIALDVSGALDVEALSWSFEEIVRRHEVLRTRFSQHDGHGIQLIDAVWQERLEVEDLSSLPAAVQADEVDSRIIREAERPFDLESGPVFRATLLKLAESRHVLLISMHHIVSDGWSMGVLVREIGSLYTARITGTEVPLGDLPIQYADYAVWERQWMQGDVLENELAYWRTQLQDLTPLELPTDHPRPAVATHSGASVPVALDAELVKDLTALARQEGVTLFMLLLAAFYLLLSRYSGQKDITVGTDVANRNRLETEALIGFFVNQLVLRADLDGDPTVGQFLGNVRDLCLNAYAYQNLPFGKLVQELNPQRDLGREPLFQLKLVLQNAPLGELKAGDIEFDLRQQQDRIAKLDLQIVLQEGGGLVAGNCIYATDLFERETVERMVGHWQNLLRSLVANPQRRLSELEMLSEAERVLLLDTWNRTKRPYPKEKTVPRLFEEQVERTPESPAVIFEEEQLSYRELNERSNQVAHYLRHLGVGPETRVGICVERSLELVIGLLGILKAGGAYVPLDPEYPQERLAFMMEDAQVAVLLTHRRTWTPNASCPKVSLDEDWPSIATEPITNPDPGLHPDNAVYVIYTSGSTGRPKGVVIAHGSVVNRLLWMESEFNLHSHDIVLQRTRLNFDVSVWEIFASLVFGAQVILLPASLEKDPHGMALLLAASGVTIVNFTPALLKLFIQVPNTDQCVKLRHVLCGASELSATIAQALLAVLPEVHLHNLYGPTEATIDVTKAALTTSPELTPSQHTVPIGRPSPNTQIYLLDGAMEPVPVGVGGELYIGGAGLARGYLNRPGLTAERFVPNPFGEAGSRLYRTGDLGRYRPDGNIDFLGRIDDQVKIRGYRIEPGEVEVVLGSHPMIREAVVIARTTEQGDKRLVGYLVADQERVSVGELREYMQQRLPDHMVPSAFVYLEALPLTVNGKLDRRALPEPEQAAERPGSYVAPRNVTEEILCGIWEDVLGVERVGIEDNFFELGGDSILSLQLIERAKHSRLNITIKQVIRYQTIAELSQVAEPLSGTVTIANDTRDLPTHLPLTPAQSWFFGQNFDNPSHWNQAVMISVPSHLRPDDLRSSVLQVLSQHDSLRLYFERSGDGEWYSKHAPFAALESSYSTVSLRSLSHDQQAEALSSYIAALQADMSLEHAPLIRVVYFDLAETERRLLFLAHHLIVDVISWRIVLTSLQQCAVQPGGLVEHSDFLPTPFAKWAVALSQYAQSPDLLGELPYWEAELAKVKVDLRREKGTAKDVDTFGTASVLDIYLSEQITSVLLNLTKLPTQANFQELLLTAILRAFTRWNSCESLLIEVEAHGRDISEDLFGESATGLVGWLTNTYPLALQTSGGSFSDDLTETFRQSRLVPNSGIGYGLLRHLSVEGRRRLANLNRPRILFNFGGRLDNVLTDDGWSIAPEGTGRIQSDSAKLSFPIEVKSYINEGRLALACVYASSGYTRETMQKIFSDVISELTAVAATGRAS